MRCLCPIAALLVLITSGVFSTHLRAASPEVGDPAPGVMPCGSGCRVPGERLSLDEGWRFHRGDIPFPLITGHDNSYNNAKAGTARARRP